MIYFDNSATSFPKPPAVIEAVVDYMTKIGANPGRAGHKKAIEAGEIVFRTRKVLAEFFKISSPMNVIFGLNATDALNLAIKGVLCPGDHVITSSLEHNSVIRPLKRLEEDGIISLTVLDGDERGLISVPEIEKMIRPETKALILNHMSNVTGSVQPVREIGAYCRSKKIIFVLDCAQSAGIIPIDLKSDNIDMICFAGHKGLYGPTGTGGMVISDSYDVKKMKPHKEGGTGSMSDKIFQPNFLPDMYESGTLNVAGIAGLCKGVEFLKNFPGGFETISVHKKELQKYFIEKASKKVEGFKSFSSPEALGVASFTIDGISVSEITQKLSDQFNIMSRQGLHCSPMTHKKIGTFPEGTVRFSFGVFNTAEEVKMAVSALIKIKESHVN
jgi:cysteine desulfurase / selenocysteine lyase